MKHITEASDEEIATIVLEVAEVYYDTLINEDEVATALRAAFDFSPPQPTWVKSDGTSHAYPVAGDGHWVFPQPTEAELIAEANRLIEERRTSRGYLEQDYASLSRHMAEVMTRLVSALSAQPVPPAVPGDEELLNAYRAGMEADMQEQYKYRDYASSAERRTMVAGLRAVAALSTPKEK